MEISNPPSGQGGTNDFFKYFLAENTAHCFFRSMDKQEQVNNHLMVDQNDACTSYITSCPNLVNTYEHRVDQENKATCIIKPKSKYWDFFIGFSNGDIELAKRETAWMGERRMLESIHDAPIIALAKGKGDLSGQYTTKLLHTTEPFLLAGYADNTIAFISSNHSTKFTLDPNGHPISCIAPGPVPHSWMVGRGNTVTLYKNASNTSVFKDKDNKNIEVQKASLALTLNEKPIQVAEIGVCQNSIVIKPANTDHQLVWLPYSVADYNTIRSLDFSRGQLEYMLWVIKAHERKSRVQFSPSSKHRQMFLSLPPAVQDVMLLNNRDLGILG
jgi:hypothetical protein